MTTKKSLMLAALLLAGLFSTATAADFVRVAYDDAGEASKQVHLIEGEDWVFQAPGVATPAAQSCVFGSTVAFAYDGLVPQSAYKVKLTFFADENRKMTVKAGKLVLGEATAERNKTTTAEFTVPAAAYAGRTLTISLDQVSGPNAVVSEIEILSDNPVPLGVLPENKIKQSGEFMLSPMPRLSPQPVEVAGVSKPAFDLGGIWKFSPAPPANFAAAAPADWSDIQVPGEWAMQGFDVKPGTAAGYFRTFTVPKDWSGKRIKLRCDAVYSDAVVFINGRVAGKHSGGFTPFELDVTDFVNPKGENTIAMSVLNESVADQLASGSKYACHQLGGISRGIRLFVVPESSVASLQVITAFDKTFRDATLTVALEAVTEGAKPAGLQAVLSLTAPDGKRVRLSADRISLESLQGKISVPVSDPARWDNEHPNLYTLTIKLESGGKVIETISKRIGFRQVEVRGNELFVNGRAVKLRASNHHEVYPLTGRSLPAGIHRRDIELFREGNVNLLRTCHYPPDEALMDAADELGMFIECEAPFCWSPGGGHVELVARQTAEMVLNFRNHPSVLFWSLANESSWGANFIASSKVARQLDPTRPQTFNWGTGGIQTVEEKYCEIANIHYPEHSGPAQARKYTKRPVYLGEDSHLNAYNRLELATDPALRDIWGRYFRELWDDIYNTKGCLGQAIWSGVDDTFYMKNDQTVGYGTWGPIDGWRRPKPEYWGMKKAYSPVLIYEPERAAYGNGAVGLYAQNRQTFANLNEMKVTWKIGSQKGVAEVADIPPGAKGAVTIWLDKAPKAGEKLELTFTDPRGFVADKYELALAGIPAKPDSRKSAVSPPPATFTETAEVITINDGAAAWQVSKATGQIVSADKVSVTGPQLMLLPLNSAGETQMTGKTKVWTPFTEPCAGWNCGKVSVAKENGAVTVAVEGKYQDAEGSYKLAFANGRVNVAYGFIVTKGLNPRQVGLVFSLPRECEVFSWDRKGYWDVYPQDHIARLKGTVKASEGFEATSVGPRTKPAHPWRLDNLPYGNNDFCSTKHNVITATLADAKGNGLTTEGQGKQHVRCWQTAKAANILIADYSNGGSERFLRGMASKDDRPLKAGDKVSGTVTLQMAK